MFRLLPLGSRDTVRCVASSEAFWAGQTPDRKYPNYLLQSQYRAPVFTQVKCYFGRAAQPSWKIREDPGRDGGTLERPSSCGCTAWNRSMDATSQQCHIGAT